MAGTKYLVKQDLINSVVAKIFPNNNFAITGAGEQKALLDMVESLWDRAVSFNETTYNDLVTDIANGDLVPGAFYKFEYQCIHQIPGTSVLNINSAQYVEILENFIVQAISATEISPIAKSLENPNDVIIWDHSLATAEDGTTARTGKVLWRNDVINDLSTFYDFRGVYFRRGALDTASTIPVWSTRQNWTRGQMAIFSSDTLARAGFAMTPDTTGFGGIEWQSISPSTSGVKWVWLDNASYMGDNIPRTNTQDYLTFSGASSHIHIGKTSLNNGYNNIVLTACTDIKLGDDSANSHLISCNGVYAEASVVNCLMGVLQNIRIREANSSYVWSCTDSDIVCPNNDAYLGCDDIHVGTNGSGNNFKYVRRSEIGSDFVDNTTSYIVDTKIGVNATSNILQNIEDTHIKNTLNNNTLVGIRWSNIYNEVNNCSFITNSGMYNVYEHVTIEDKCTDLSCTSGGNVQRVVFGKGCSNIDVEDGGDLVNVVFGQECSNFTIRGGSSIVDSVIGSNCSNFTIRGGCSISRCDIKASCEKFTLENGAVIQDTKIGPNALLWNLGATSGGSIIGSLFGSFCTNLTVDNGGSIADSWIGEDVNNVNIDTAGILNGSYIDSGSDGVTIQSSAQVNFSKLGKANSFNINTGSITNSIIGSGNANLTFQDGVIMNNSVIGAGVTDKTFDGTVSTNFSNLILRAGDTTALTIDNDTNLAKTNRVVDKTVVANVLALDLRTEPYLFFNTTNAADADVNLTGTPGNVDIDFIFNNSDASAHNITFNQNHGASPTSVVVNIPAGETHFIKLKRVLTSGVDKLIVEESYLIV